MLVFHRQSFSELWITIRAGESLGLLDISYIEDYFGVDSQLTLHNMDSGERISFVMEEDVDETPSISHDVFTGFIDLSELEDGFYQVEGRVKDNLGNYRILSAFSSPNGSEDTTLFEIQITPLSVVVHIPKTAQVFQAIRPETDVFLLDKHMTEIQLLDLNIMTDLYVTEKPELDIDMAVKPDSDVSLTAKPELDITNVFTSM